MNRTVISTGASNGSGSNTFTSGNPFTGFTTLGAIVVAILLIAFIRNRVVTIFLGTLLVAYLLINSRKVIPMFFNSNIASNSLGSVGL